MFNGKQVIHGQLFAHSASRCSLDLFFRSPAHPALMATASSNGTLGLWNLAQSLEEPITGSDGIVVEPDGGSGRGLNKIKWSSDGRRMLVASTDRVHVLVLAEDVVRQKGDEDARMMHHITSRGLLGKE
jgi:dynein intermediate chain, cytosolic